MRVWAQQEFMQDNILVLTDDELIVGTLHRTDVEPARRQIERGTPPDKVLGRSATAVPLAGVEALQLNNLKASLTVGVREGRRQVEKTIQMLAPRHREVFDEIRDRAGGEWEESTEPTPVLTAIQGPITLLVVLAFVGGLVIFGMMSNGPDSGVPIELVAGIVGAVALALIGWAVVAIAMRQPGKVTAVRSAKAK